MPTGESVYSKTETHVTPENFKRIPSSEVLKLCFSSNMKISNNDSTIRDIEGSTNSQNMDKSTAYFRRLSLTTKTASNVVKIPYIPTRLALDMAPVSRAD